jgi:hypothetical protein
LTARWGFCFRSTAIRLRGAGPMARTSRTLDLRTIDRHPLARRRTDGAGGRYPGLSVLLSSTGIPAQRGPCFFVAADYRKDVPETRLG